MAPQWVSFIHGNAALVIGGITTFAVVALIQGCRLYRQHAEQEYKARLIDRGLSVEEVERVVAATGATGPSWLDRFAGLSGWAKAGIIIAAVMIANMIMVAVIVVAETSSRSGMR